jgi:RNA chaperone Hfq
MMTDLKNSLRPPIAKPQVINNKPPVPAPTPAPAPPKAPAPVTEILKEPRECDATLYGKAKTDRRAITFRLIDGSTVTGLVVGWSRFSVLVELESALEVVFKHAMVTARLLKG